jgi:hypothetical protein
MIDISFYKNLTLHLFSPNLDIIHVDICTNLYFTINDRSLLLSFGYFSISMNKVRFVTQAANLFNPNQNDKRNPAKHAQYFESPTVIRYEKDQVLAPHFDANKAASTEDVNRGGQTLATLLVYLNDVENGGNTRFGRLVAEKEETNISNSGSPLTVKPKMGDALLFFPADKDGTFDERLEHEGCLAVDTKWIARIWRHIDRVPPPFGLSNGALSKL